MGQTSKTENCCDVIILACRPSDASVHLNLGVSPSAHNWYKPSVIVPGGRVLIMVGALIRKSMVCQKQTQDEGLNYKVSVWGCRHAYAE